MLRSLNEWVRVECFIALTGETKTRVYELITEGRLRAKDFQGVRYVNVRSWNDLIENEGTDVVPAKTQEHPQGRPRRDGMAAPQRKLESAGPGGRKERLRTRVAPD